MAMDGNSLKFRLIILLALILEAPLLYWFLKPDSNYVEVVHDQQQVYNSLVPLRFAPNSRNGSNIVAAKDNFDEILKSTRDKNVFFIETDEKRASLHNVFVCNIESAAKYNPEYRVSVVVAEESELNELPKHFEQIENVQLLKANFDKLSENTPVEKLWKSGNVSNSYYRLAHISDLFRAVLLYKYGGLYMDQDTLSLRPMPEYETFIGSEVVNVLINGVMKFKSNHYLLNEYLQQFSQIYNPNDFSGQGPILLTKIAEKHCINSSSEFLVDRKCDKFKLIRSQYTCPLYAPDWVTLFQYPKNLTATLNRLENLGSFAMHMWHQYMLSNTTLKTIQRGHLMYKYAQMHCPYTEEYLFRPNIGVGFYQY